MPPSVDLGLYRLIGEALDATSGAARVAIDFDPGVRLHIHAAPVHPPNWPSPVMRERVALCDGTISAEPSGDGRPRLSIVLARTFEGALS